MDGAGFTGTEAPDVVMAGDVPCTAAIHATANKTASTCFATAMVARLGGRKNRGLVGAGPRTLWQLGRQKELVANRGGWSPLVSQSASEYGVRARCCTVAQAG